MLHQENHHTARNMVARLRSLARERAGDVALISLTKDGPDGEARFDYATLDQRVRALACELQGRFAPGERALLLLDNDHHYVIAFFACLYAGLVAVPAFPPESLREQHLARLVAIAADSKAVCVLTSSGLAELMGGQLARLSDCCIAVDEISDERAAGWREHEPADHDIAFLQYTSGSTSAPKGVMVSHANLMANERAIESCMSVGPDDVIVSWLPLYHDMGLIGGLLQGLYRGRPVVLMSPQFFLERPVRWLQAISRHRGTISGGPDFAYRLCLERIKPSQRAELDLSSWRLAFSGAEPVRHDTLQAFIEQMAPAGFDAAAIYPCYGLAEATLLVSGGDRATGLVARGFSAQALTQGRAEPDAHGNTLVACGAVTVDHELRIVEPASRQALADGHVGEIWVAGPSIAAGYWQRPQESAQTFVEHDGRRWLRTGDLGFTHEGQLYIAGRQKDLIILRGRNHYPQDIEQAIEAEVEAVRKGRVAAFAAQAPDGTECVGIAAEVSRGLQKLVPPAALVDALNLAVSAACGEPAAVVLLLQPGGLPKTSSGKLQRTACRKGWQEGTLEAYAIHQHGRFVLGGGGQGAPDSAPLQGPTEQALAGLWQQVLQREAPTRETHFFSAGGNSLAAVQLAARIGRQWSIELPVRAVFERARLHELAAEIDRLKSSGEARAREPAIGRLTSRDGLLPLSHAQRQQWVLWQLDPQSAAYHVGGVLQLIGRLDTAALQGAFDDVVRRHESLRTVFEAGPDGLPGQRILPAAQIELTQADLRGLPAEQADHEAQQLLQQPFDLTRGPLLRALLLRVGDEQHRLIVVMHHIVCDGASMQILVGELVACYLARTRGGEPAVLPALPIQYADYAAWQQGALTEREAQRQLSYWRAQLGDEHPVLPLPVDHPRRRGGSNRAAAHAFDLPADVLADLRGLAGVHGATLFMALLAGFQALLHRWCGSSDVRVGVPMANRHRLETESLVGFFINTQVLRNGVHGRLPLAQVLAQAREAALGAQAHADLPFERLVEALQPERSSEQAPLFQVMFNHRLEDFRELQRVPGLAIEARMLGEPTAQFDLALDTIESTDGAVRATFTYAAELFEPGTMQRLAQAYLAMLRTLARQPQQAVGEVALLSDADQAALARWSHNPQRYPADEPVYRLIEQQVAQRPEATALVFGDQALSYVQLNERANRLAHRLIAEGVRPESRVGIAVERSVEMVVGLLAILKAGAAYVPLDPEYPQDRLAYMVADSGIALLLTQSQVCERVAQPGLKVLELGGLSLQDEPSGNPAVPVHGEQLAYVIYTSGSTGRPKGIGIAHHALAEHAQVAVGFFALTPADRVLQFSTLNFDGCVEQIYPTLCAGAALVLRGPELWDSETFHRELIERRISVADLTTAYWHLLVQDFSRRRRHAYGALRQVHAGGEAMPPEALKAWRDAGLGHVALRNTYGPTEATVTATVLDCAPYVTGDEPLPAQMPIGAPLPGRTLYVLDGDLQPVLPGVPGELCIGGDLLARGYVNRAALTAERFVADPHGGEGGRLYRTGDLVRWGDDGSLQYLGRIDHQVKIRGFRIEPAEVEAHLLDQGDVRQAVVLARSSPGGQQLVAYVSPQPGGVLEAAALRARLAAALPDYMVPAAIVVLPALPIGPGGKLDRHALPAPETGDATRYEAPQGEAETALAALWAEVLGQERIGRHDNFFERGGHSLAAVQITALLRQRHGCELPVRQFFEQATLKELAAGLPAGLHPAGEARQHRLAEIDRLLSEFEA